MYQYQKKFSVPAKSIAPTPPPPWRWLIHIINTNFSKWTKTVTPIAFIQKKIVEFDTIMYKNHFQIFADGFKINEKTESPAFPPPLNIAMGERMYKNVCRIKRHNSPILLYLALLFLNDLLISVWCGCSSWKTQSMVLFW